ncbi:PB1 domain-containing protein, partial [Tanacetum coccineum]
MVKSMSSRTTGSEAVVLASSPVVTSHTDDFPTTNENSDLDIDNEISPESFTLENEQNVATQWEKIITGVDQRFAGFDEFREALHKFSIAHGFRYKYKKSDSHRVSVRCKS